MPTDALATAMAELVMVMRGVLKTAVEETPEDAIDLICDYFGDAGADLECEETATLMERWVKVRGPRAFDQPI